MIDRRSDEGVDRQTVDTVISEQHRRRRRRRLSHLSPNAQTQKRHKRATIVSSLLVRSYLAFGGCSAGFEDGNGTRFVADDGRGHLDLVH